MAMFNSYVKLPEGKQLEPLMDLTSKRVMFVPACSVCRLMLLVTLIPMALAMGHLYVIGGPKKWCYSLGKCC
jgi:hypothetical protein